MTTKKVNKKKPTKKYKKVKITDKGLQKGKKETDFFYSNKKQYSAIQSYKHEREKKDLLKELLTELEEMAKSSDIKIAARAEKKIQKIEQRLEASLRRLRDKRTRLNVVLDKINVRTYDKKGKRLVSDNLITEKRYDGDKSYSYPTMVVYQLIGELPIDEITNLPDNYKHFTTSNTQKMKVPKDYNIEYYIRSRLPFDTKSLQVEILSIQIIHSNVPKSRATRGKR